MRPFLIFNSLADKVPFDDLHPLGHLETVRPVREPLATEGKGVIRLDGFLRSCEGLFPIGVMEGENVRVRGFLFPSVGLLPP